MNIAFPALLVFLILLPGFIFRSRYKRAERTSLDYSPFGQVVAEAVLWALAAHVIWLSLSYAIFTRSVDPKALLSLLIAAPKEQADAIEIVGREFNWIGLYFSSLFAASFTVSAAARMAISKYQLDRQGHRFFSLFRFHHAPWYYLLSGADFDDASKPDLIVVSAIVNVAGSAVLYVGIVEEFFVNADGGLDRLVLREVMRRPIERDKESEDADASTSRFYLIDGDYFVLRYEETITLNVQYLKISETNSLPITGP